VEDELGAPDAKTRMPPDVAGNAGYLLSRLGLRSRRLFADAIAELGIRPPHFGILVVLAGHDALAQSELADALGVDRGQLVGLLDELEREGLVRRDIDPNDRRRHAVSLTAEGARREAQARRLASAAEQELLAALTAEEQDDLRRLLVRLAMQ
jgi:DNA-binding MarR family transcriptional regulator